MYEYWILMKIDGKCNESSWQGNVVALEGHVDGQDKHDKNEWHWWCSQFVQLFIMLVYYETELIPMKN